jgi:pimeloyl-ACP methyl ester carboxylesterase
MKMNGLPTVSENYRIPEPIKSDDLISRSKCRFPVYAAGYNWLASNKDAASALQTRILKIIDENNRGGFKCKQVILVTHSMGGLVARACSQLPAMEKKIAGIVHGVMPSVGAAVAYRRCKIGMRDEDFKAGLVIGSTGQEVTAVFAQAPGALQLLPSIEYGPFWLQFKNESGNTIERMPAKDPYAEIYLRKDRWWGLVREEWLKPDSGSPIDWNRFVYNVTLARDFHNQLAGKFHPRTYVFYGAGDGKQASFQTVRWTMNRGSDARKPVRTSEAENMNLSHAQIREDGTNNIHVGGEKIFSVSSGVIGFGVGFVASAETGSWAIQCESQDACGDGTVPASSGMSPRESGGKNIREQFRLTGFSHEPAYKDAVAQRVTHYAITKIAAAADLP